MSIEINTTEYVFSHGKAPRGTGSWFFFGNRCCQFIAGSYASFNGTFAEAKQQAKAWAKANRFHVIYVGA